MTVLEAPTRYLEWMLGGREYFQSQLALIEDDQLARPLALPNWTGKHLLSHVAGNARALGRLARWASTGEPHPMYAGPDERAREIETNAGLDASVLRAAVEYDQHNLEDALGRLDGAGWASSVVTAQGRAVDATAIPWLRSRELWIHGADLTGGAGFDDFPGEFLGALLADVLTWRRELKHEVLDIRPLDGPTPDLSRETVWIEGSSADLARWLTGRGANGVRHSDDSPLPTLTPWL
jgi:maleylpyruvate isomerase